MYINKINHRKDTTEDKEVAGEGKRRWGSKWKDKVGW